MWALVPRGVAQAPNGAWVYPSPTGNLLYQLDERGQRIADFSHCGYRGGTEPLPDVTALIPQGRWVYVNPGAGDDTALIQAAINSVQAFTPDANGWRGVVFLNAGEYQLATTISLTASGVVLKGAGDSPTTGTRLRAMAMSNYRCASFRRATTRGRRQCLVRLPRKRDHCESPAAHPHVRKLRADDHRCRERHGE